MATRIWRHTIDGLAILLTSWCSIYTYIFSIPRILYIPGGCFGLLNQSSVSRLGAAHASDHQLLSFYFLSGRFQPKPSFATRILEGGHQKYLCLFSWWCFTDSMGFITMFNHHLGNMCVFCPTILSKSKLFMEFWPTLEMAEKKWISLGQYFTLISGVIILLFPGCLYFHPNLGRWSDLTSICFKSIESTNQKSTTS